MMKTYKTLLALVLLALGAVSASAVKADLDPAMFKGWDSPLPGANVVDEPEAIDDGANKFVCDYRLFEEVGTGVTIFGNQNVYYLWYADVTGTKTLTFEGTPGMQFRILINRAEPNDEGGDAHGAAMVAGVNEITCTIGEDGKAVVDLSAFEYVHINAIKTGWNSEKGTLTKMELDGSVKPVSGWVDMLDNNDLEGTDVHNYVVALHATTDQNNYPATIVDGAGVDGSRAIVVESASNPSEDWETQIFFASNEYLPEGTQWRLSMDIKADRDATITTGCHAEPRSWIANNFFPQDPQFTTQWQHFESEGTLTAAMVGEKGLRSIALNLNVDKTSNKYYFDNIHFEVFKETSPISLVSAQFAYDVIAIDFGKATNMADLIKATGKDRIIFPNDIVTIKVDGQPTTLLSVEGRSNGKVYAFIDEGFSDNSESVVEVSFTNPAGDQHLVYTQGKFTGEAVPDFTNVKASFLEDLAMEYSYLLGTPMLAKAEPEDGSFNLPVDMKEFKYTFEQEVEASIITATLDKEKLTVSPADGRSKVITLTRTGSDNLTQGLHVLKLQNVMSREDQIEDPGNFTFNLSFGPVVIDPNDHPDTLVSVNLFNETANGTVPVGYTIWYQAEKSFRNNPTSYSSGPRMFGFAGDFTKGLYWREGYVEYGSTPDYALTLEANKTYEISFNTARWKSNGEWTKFVVLDESGFGLDSIMVQNNPDVNGKSGSGNPVKGSTRTIYTYKPDYSGNYLLRWVSTDASGNQGYHENLLANVMVRYVPNSPGVAEMTKLNGALADAKAALENNSGERFDGPAYDALKAIIEKTESEMASYTGPSACYAAVDALLKAKDDMDKHRELIDTYDPLPQKGQDILDANAEKKFAKTHYYTDLQTVVAKYGQKQKQQETDDEGNTYETEILVIKLLKDDAELTAAISELDPAIKTAFNMFTEGPTQIYEDWRINQGQPNRSTGYAPLTEQLRLGAEALKSLGAPADDPLVQAAYNALSDDQELAKAIQNRIKVLLYGQLKDDKQKLFETTYDENFDPITPTFDMSVFVQNPIIYKTKATKSENSAPGWIADEFREMSSGWSEYATDEIPADGMFSSWNSSYRVHQTVTGLPVGVYTLKAGFGERRNDNDLTEGSHTDGSYFFAQFANGDSLTAQCPYFGQSFPYRNLAIEEVTIVDGEITLGVQTGSKSSAFFNDVALYMTAAVQTFDYAQAYEEVLAGIDETQRSVSVRAIQLFDLNGRRIDRGRSGVVIVKKLMSDGTVRTEKVVVK